MKAESVQRTKELAVVRAEQAKRNAEAPKEAWQQAHTPLPMKNYKVEAWLKQPIALAEVVTHLTADTSRLHKEPRSVQLAVLAYADAVAAGHRNTCALLATQPALRWLMNRQRRILVHGTLNAVDGFAAARMAAQSACLKPEDWMLAGSSLVVVQVTEVES